MQYVITYIIHTYVFRMFTDELRRQTSTCTDEFIYNTLEKEFPTWFTQHVSVARMYNFSFKFMLLSLLIVEALCHKYLVMSIGTNEHL